MNSRIIFTATFLASVLLWMFIYERLNLGPNLYKLSNEKLCRTKITKDRLGIVTFLSTRTENKDDLDDYYNATRVLAYKLLHDPITKTKQSIPLVVMITETVQEWKRDQLINDGAIVVEVDYVNISDSLKKGERRWVDQYTKLRIWQLTMFDRMLYIDSDMLIVKCMDGVFDDPASYPISVKDKTEEILRKSPIKSNIPHEYLLAGIDDPGRKNSPIPRQESKSFNGGFYIFKPCSKLFRRYLELLDHPEKYSSNQMEQGLLNYAHNINGNMPWRRLESGKWNVNWPNYADYEYGVASLHDKFWWTKDSDSRLAKMWYKDLNRVLERDKERAKHDM